MAWAGPAITPLQGEGRKAWTPAVLNYHPMEYRITHKHQVLTTTPIPKTQRASLEMPEMEMRVLVPSFPGASVHSTQLDRHVNSSATTPTKWAAPTLDVTMVSTLMLCWTDFSLLGIRLYKNHIYLVEKNNFHSLTTN